MCVLLNMKACQDIVNGTLSFETWLFYYTVRGGGSEFQVLPRFLFYLMSNVRLIFENKILIV